MPQHEYRTAELDPDLLSTPFGVQTNWRVITGAQSSGKTTLVDQLAGEGFRTVPEVARQYFEAEMARGRTMEEITEDHAAVERRLMDIQLEIERELQAADVVFLDRALPDMLTFYRFFELNPNEILLECFDRRYASVFILDRLPFHQDGLRDEIDVSARFLDEWLDRDYSALGYDVVRVPVLPPQERLAFVLDMVVQSLTWP